MNRTAPPEDDRTVCLARRRSGCEASGRWKRWEAALPVELNHTIVSSSNKRAAAEFLARILGVDSPREVSHFVAVQLNNGVTLDFDDADAAFERQHYAFLVGDDEFEQIFQRVSDQSIDYFADPNCTEKGSMNGRNGGRGFYFRDPDGHLMEVFTKVPLP
jgi:catechol 2,3-dioxygenase-like lactoylglutathione lyase family enzyme